jgi:hypothetical protein
MRLDAMFARANSLNITYVAVHNNVLALSSDYDIVRRNIG